MTNTENTTARIIDVAAAATQTEMFGEMDATARAAISASLAVVAAAERHLVETVRHQRSMGATWQELADILGTSRQAAQQRFGNPS